MAQIHMAYSFLQLCSAICLQDQKSLITDSGAWHGFDSQRGAMERKGSKEIQQKNIKIEHGVQTGKGKGETN